MRVLACPCDRQGCGRYRLGNPISALQRLGSSDAFMLSEGLPVRFDPRTGQPLGLADGFGGFDCVVVQRPMADWQVEALRDCRRMGIATVVEVDDDFAALHPLSPAFVTTHPRLAPGWNRSWLTVACREADLVTVSTQALADRYAPHGRVVVLRNYIPETWLGLGLERDANSSSKRNVVGWSGTVGTHQGDLAVTYGGVAAAVREAGARFRVIGNPELVARDLSLDAEPECTGWSDYEDYPSVVAGLDVGIAPLADSAFNRAKSWLKPLEMAALGVPCVMSPLTEYQAIRREGIGVVARDRSRDWRREVLRLLTDERARSEASAVGHEAASGLTIEEHCWRWPEAWEVACRTRRSLRSGRSSVGAS